MTEHVVLFAGPMGAGKTTAIRSISEIEVVSTEAANTDRATVDKPTTTVALDYGEILIAEDEKVRLYGIPGQRRFRFMWQILKERARGMILLVNNDAAEPIADMLGFLDEFGELYERGGVVIGVTRTDVGTGPSLADYIEALEAAYPSLVVPVFTVDPRERGDVRIAMLALIANIEMRDTYRAAEAATA
jgi:signal recognition particle receptor subunit beta